MRWQYFFSHEKASFGEFSRPRRNSAQSLGSAVPTRLSAWACLPACIVSATLWYVNVGRGRWGEPGPDDYLPVPAPVGFALLWPALRAARRPPGQAHCLGWPGVPAKMFLVLVFVPPRPPSTRTTAMVLAVLCRRRVTHSSDLDIFLTQTLRHVTVDNWWTGALKCSTCGGGVREPRRPYMRAHLSDLEKSSSGRMVDGVIKICKTRRLARVLSPSY